MTDAEKLQLKQSIKESCIQVLHGRITTIEDAMKSSQESANSEEKSSAGDKYETGRAMNHLAQEMLNQQLDDANHELALLHAVDVSTVLNKVATGAVVVTDTHLLFIGPGLGKVQLGAKTFMALSPKAPLAAALLDKRTGEQITFSAKPIKIVEVY